MQDFVGSVRRSLVFKPSAAGDDGSAFGGFVEKIGSTIRKSRIGLFSKPPIPKPDPLSVRKDDAPPIRWRKGELIGCGAFGRVYMGMNLDSGELLAVKQVSIAVNSASKEKTQAHIRELEEEVKLLKNLSHPNIVRYLGTAREDESLNILLEFVPGGSISSLLGKFGSFPESVIRMYAKQLLLGLEYLHKNGIMHRDIKGANILVDNKGCIKLADFGASKKVVELATMTGAKSMKGTPYWMAPEVILQTGHSFSADIWSVGCTVIEMATGKPPWSQQYQEVAALFHIGTTKSHPPIPDHLSAESKDFLLKCLQKEPDFRLSASDLLQHPFVIGEYLENQPALDAPLVESSGNQRAASRTGLTNLLNPNIRSISSDMKGMSDMDCVSGSTVYPENYLGRDSQWGSSNYDDDMCQSGSTVYPENYLGRDSQWGSSNYDDDMCQIDDKDDLMTGSSMKFCSSLLSADFNKSFNPISEPNDDWPCKFDDSPVVTRSRMDSMCDQTNDRPDFLGTSCNLGSDFTFPSGPAANEDDDEVTESKIRAFLDEKALDLKKMQTPLYEQFYNSLNAAGPQTAVGSENKENLSNNMNLPPKSKSPNQLPRRRLSAAIDVSYTASPGCHSKRVSNIGESKEHIVQEVQSPQHDLCSQEPSSPSASFSERQRKWKEELDQELERKRELLRQAGMVRHPR